MSAASRRVKFRLGIGIRWKCDAGYIWVSPEELKNGYNQSSPQQIEELPGPKGFERIANMKNHYRFILIAVVVMTATASAFAQCTWSPTNPSTLTSTCDAAIVNGHTLSITGNANVINADGGTLTADVIRSTRGGGAGFFLGTASGFVFQAAGALILKTGPTAGTTQEWMRITPNGTIGINGTPSLASTNQLEVYGNVLMSGTVLGGNIQARYQDLAEWVPASGDLTPGTVVVLNTKKSNEVVKSEKAYDTLVAGVVSAKPGFLLGEAGANKEKVATTGRVKVWVDATKHPVKIGDLLVTSDKPGMAMVSVPIDVGGAKIHRPGTIIGKALEPLDKGQGEILILLSMQ